MAKVTRNPKPPSNVGKIIRGTIIERYFRCRKASCACQKGKKIHGPHYYITYSTEKNSRQVYVPRQLLDVVREYVKNYEKLWEFIKGVSEWNIRRLFRRGKR